LSYLWYDHAKAIDKLEAPLNGEVKSGSMFAPEEYIQIYT
jgi:hypothetical protein